MGGGQSSTPPVQQQAPAAQLNFAPAQAQATSAVGDTLSGGQAQAFAAGSPTSAGTNWNWQGLGQNIAGASSNFSKQMMQAAQAGIYRPQMNQDGTVSVQPVSFSFPQVGGSGRTLRG